MKRLPPQFRNKARLVKKGDEIIVITNEGKAPEWAVPLERPQEFWDQYAGVEGLIRPREKGTHAPTRDEQVDAAISETMRDAMVGVASGLGPKEDILEQMLRNVVDAVRPVIPDVEGLDLAAAEMAIANRIQEAEKTAKEDWCRTHDLDPERPYIRPCLARLVKAGVPLARAIGIELVPQEGFEILEEPLAAVEDCHGRIGAVEL